MLVLHEVSPVEVLTLLFNHICPSAAVESIAEDIKHILPRDRIVDHADLGSSLRKQAELLISYGYLAVFCHEPLELVKGDLVPCLILLHDHVNNHIEVVKAELSEALRNLIRNVVRDHLVLH